MTNDKRMSDERLDELRGSSDLRANLSETSVDELLSEIDALRTELAAAQEALLDHEAHEKWCTLENADLGRETKRRKAAETKLAQAERERDEARMERDLARDEASAAEDRASLAESNPWPEWAEGILKDLRNLGFQYDAGEEIDLRGDFVDHVNQWVRGVERKYEAKLATAREAALEEAARVADHMAGLGQSSNAIMLGKGISSAIRALSPAPPDQAIEHIRK